MRDLTPPEKAMNAQTYFPTIVGGWLAVFAVCAAAQTPQTSATQPPPSATQPPPATTPAAKEQQAAPTGAPAKAHHATKQHKAMHARPQTEPTVSPGETQYRTALRRCVEGQAAQRDRCLDDAIARYGRS